MESLETYRLSEDSQGTATGQATEGSYAEAAFQVSVNLSPDLVPQFV